MCLASTLPVLSRWRRAFASLPNAPHPNPQEERYSCASSMDSGIKFDEKTNEATSNHSQRAADGPVAQNSHPPAYEPRTKPASEQHRLEKERAVRKEEFSSLRTELREIRRQLGLFQRVWTWRSPRRVTPEEDEDKKQSSEEPCFRMPGKLFTFDEDAREWKQRGTGDITLLRREETGRTYLFVRRAKTLQVIANHDITPEMKLTPGARCDRSWVWRAPAGVSETEPGVSCVAVRFCCAAEANRFKNAFIQAQQDSLGLIRMRPAAKAGEKELCGKRIKTDAGDA